jgi:DNA polymerase epsilon subunit 3
LGLTRYSANDNTERSSKKTIQPDDVFDAVRDLEFEAFLPRLEAEFRSMCFVCLGALRLLTTLAYSHIEYSTTMCDKRNSYRRKIREEAKPKSGTDAANGTDASELGADASAMDGVAGSEAQNAASSSAKDGTDGERAKKKLRRSPGADGEEDIDEDLNIHEDEDIPDDEDMDEDEEPDEVEEEEDQPVPGEDKEDLLEERAVVEVEDEAIDDEDSD